MSSKLHTDLSNLYNPSITDLELDEHHGTEKPVIYLHQAEELLANAVLDAQIEIVKSIYNNAGYGDYNKQEIMSHIEKVLEVLTKKKGQ